MSRSKRGMKGDDSDNYPHTLLIKTKPPTVDKYPFYTDRIVQTPPIVGVFHESQAMMSQFVDRRPRRPKAEKERGIIEILGGDKLGPEEDEGEMDDVEWDPYLENPDIEEKGDKDLAKKVKKIEAELKEEKRDYGDERSVIRATTIIQKYIRRWGARERLMGLRKKANKRRYICDEILQTEKDYVHHLTVSEQVFVKPLKDLVGKKKGIAQADYQMIFGNGYASIRNVNQIFLDGLAQTLYRDSKYQTNAKISVEISKIAPYFKMYRQYCTNYKKAIDHWKSMKTSECANTLREMEKDPRTTGLGLISYLILPIQRIPRYRLLLRDLIKSTSEQHSDYNGLKSAISQIMEVADYLDVSIREMEASEELKKLREKFNSASLKGFELVSPHRRMFHEGKLYQGAKKESAQELYCFVFNDIFMITTLVKEHYHYQSHVNLTSVKLYDSDSEEHKMRFKLSCPQYNTVFLCDSAEEKKKWLFKLLEAIDNLRKQRRVTEVKDTSEDTLNYACVGITEMQDEDCVEYVKANKSVMIMYTPKQTIRNLFVSKNEKLLQWYNPLKKGEEGSLKLEKINELVTGQQTTLFKKNPKEEYQALSFSLLYGVGHRTSGGDWTGKTLDLICESKEEYSIWTRALIFILRDRGKTTAKRNRDAYKFREENRRKCRKRLITGNDAFTWGKGEAGCLGHGNNDDSNVPKIMKNFLFLDIESLAIGEACAFVTLTDGTLFSWGNGKDGKLGHGDTMNIHDPALVRSLEDHSICQVACGASHTLFLEDSGRIWGVGSNTFGQVGVNDAKNKKKMFPARVKMKEKFKYIEAGMNHSGAISQKGVLYTWGDSRDGQLGHGNNEAQIKPVIVEKLKGMQVKELAFGHSHSMALTSDCNVFTWGDGTDGQLGNGKNGKGVKSFEPMLLKSAFLKKKVRNIASGAFHCGAVTVNGKIYMWGNGIYGQIGNDKKENSVARPTLMEKLLNFPCRRLSCGGMHNIAMVEEKRKNDEVITKVIAWGAGTYGRLGLGLEKDQLAPKEIPFLMGKEVKSVIAGGCMSAAIVSHVWVPDKDIDDCMKCAKKFTFKRRKHHCRNCGGVYCGQCTKRKCILFRAGLEPSRVCDKCHKIIATRMGKKVVE